MLIGTRYFIVGLSIAVAAFFLFSSAALAIDNPETMQIRYVRSYQNVLEDNDFMFLLKYRITFGEDSEGNEIIPDTPADEAFLFRFIDDATGSELQSARPVPFNDRGYNDGAIVFYFSADEVDDLAISDSKDYRVRLQGDPAVFSSPPSVETLSITHRNEFATEFHLKEDIRALAEELQNNWGFFGDQVGALVQGEGTEVTLTPRGANYFLQVWNDFDDAVSDFFLGSGSELGFIERDHDQSFRDQLLTFWDGTELDDSVGTFANTWSISKLYVYTSIWLAATAIVSFMAIKATARPEFGFFVFVLFTPTGAYVGLVDIVFAGLVTFAFAMVTIWSFFYRQA